MLGLSGLFGDHTCLERHEEHDDSGNLALIVSTVQASDTDHKYETAISHIDINPEQWVIVEEYDTLEEATTGHQKWIETMTGDEPPESLEDVSTCWAKKLASG